MTAADQLEALSRLTEVFQDGGIEYWLFGGWAVDFHAGSITRAHADVDLAVWESDLARIAGLLAAEGWIHRPEPGEDGYTGYERGAVRLELAFITRGETGEIYTPLREGRGTWPEGSFRKDIAELAGVRARVISLGALRSDKAESRDDPVVADKDSADLATLSRLR
jgi:Aminoglycoside-2''-adenylyltransferase